MSLFFPDLSDRRQSSQASRYTEALKLCARCPVAEPCREYGQDMAYGVWGGTTPEDRGQRISPKTGLPFLRTHRQTVTS